MALENRNNKGLQPVRGKDLLPEYGFGDWLQRQRQGVGSFFGGMRQQSQPPQNINNPMAQLSNFYKANGGDIPSYQYGGMDQYGGGVNPYGYGQMNQIPVKLNYCDRSGSQLKIK